MTSRKSKLLADISSDKKTNNIKEINNCAKALMLLVCIWVSVWIKCGQTKTKDYKCNPVVELNNCPLFELLTGCKPPLRGEWGVSKGCRGLLADQTIVRERAGGYNLLKLNCVCPQDFSLRSTKVSNSRPYILQNNQCVPGRLTWKTSGTTQSKGGNRKWIPDFCT